MKLRMRRLMFGETVSLYEDHWKLVICTVSFIIFLISQTLPFQQRIGYADYSFKMYLVKFALCLC